MDKKDVIRFWKWVNISDTEKCWEWQGSKSDGYGQFGVAGKTFRAHRIAWIITHGNIPDDGSYHGICVLHKCDNRGCCNPSHLFLGTQKTNLEDMTRKGRRSLEKISVLAAINKKLSPEQVREIKKLLMAPKRERLSLRKIAKKFNVSHNNIWLIAKGISWKDT